MRSDARPSTHPIEQHVADELQAANAFDDITYEKGQAVLRMLEAYLGPDVFRDGIRRYVRARAYSNATAADLWSALSTASGTDVARVAGEWTEQAGFPLVTVAAACDAAGARTLTLSQHRFLLAGGAGGAAHWSIPLRIRSGTGEPHPLLLTRDGQKSAAGRCEEPLSVNADAIGFYRVRYDATTLATDTRAFGTLPDGDKIALLDDSWALALSGAQGLGAYLALASAMGSDEDARAWEQIAAALGAVEHDERGSAGHDAFAALARGVVKPMADQLGWQPRDGETPDLEDLRQTLIGDLGAWGDADIIAEARRRFGRFTTDRGAIRPDDQSMVLTIVAQYADAATFEQLHTIAREEHNETAQRRYYLALMEVADPALAQQAAQLALSPEIPPQAASVRLRLITALAHRHPALAWATFTANADTLLAPNPKYAPLFTAQSVPEVFWDAAEPQQIEAWVRGRLPAEMSANIRRGMEGLNARRAQKRAVLPAADAYVASRASQTGGVTGR
jgi:aminopeptidase N